MLRALSLGASGVLLGRPALWGLASGGAPGAARVLSLLAEELAEAMHLAGCPEWLRPGGCARSDARRMRASDARRMRAE